ncbi:MAG: hypothetical protein CSA81_13085 [Acidobacteria bacterium]|nr:MAG: hypothetical protein CSA81_13085 [Acidobacteriota bacterium]
MTNSISMSQAWKRMNPRVLTQDGSITKLPASWLTFTKIWLPGQLKKADSFRFIFLDLPELNSFQKSDWSFIEKKLSSLFLEQHKKQPFVALVFKQDQTEQVSQWHLGPGTTNYCLISAEDYEKRFSNSREAVSPMIENRKKRLERQIRSIGFPRLASPFHTASSRLQSHLANRDTQRNIYHKFLAYAFRKLDWKLKGQAKIKWDKNARIAYLRHHYREKNTEKLFPFLDIVKKALPFPANLLSNTALIQMMISSPDQDENHLSYQEIIRWFLEEYRPLDLGEGKMLIPPRLILQNLERDLSFFMLFDSREKHALMKIAESTSQICRHNLFMSHLFDILETTQNPIQLGNLGMEKRWQTPRKFLDTVIPDAIEGTNTILLLRDYIRNTYP